MAEQLFQIGIKGLVRNQAGEILMVHLPQKANKPAYWDLPGGRMNPGETFEQTLQRELQEEIGVSYTGQAKQLTTVQTNIAIPVSDKRYPLILMVYEVQLPTDQDIKLDPNSNEDDYGWFTPQNAASKLAHKFPDDFCIYICTLD